MGGRVAGWPGMGNLTDEVLVQVALGDLLDQVQDLILSRIRDGGLVRAGDLR